MTVARAPRVTRSLLHSTSRTNDAPVTCCDSENATLAITFVEINISDATNTPKDNGSTKYKYPRKTPVKTTNHCDDNHTLGTHHTIKLTGAEKTSLIPKLFLLMGEIARSLPFEGHMAD